MYQFQSKIFLENSHVRSFILEKQCEKGEKIELKNLKFAGKTHNHFEEKDRTYKHFATSCIVNLHISCEKLIFEFSHVITWSILTKCICLYNYFIIHLQAYFFLHLLSKRKRSFKISVSIQLVTNICQKRIWIQWRRETLSNTHFETIKLSKLQNKNKKKNTRKAQTSSWNFVKRLYFLPLLEIFRELKEIVLGLIKPFHFSA